VSRRFALLANPAARGGRALEDLPAVEGEFTRLGAEYRLVKTHSLDHACSEARVAADAGEVVVSVGGDGLAGRLAGVLRGGETALAFVPAGRGNDYARVLGIPKDMREAARIAVEGRERLVDVALANDRPYLGIASLGFDSDANRIANDARLVRGNLVYLYAALRALVSWRHAGFTVTIDGASRSFSGWSVAVANSKAYGGGMFLVPHAEIDDGRLDVFTYSATGKIAGLRCLAKVFKGEHVDKPGISFATGEVVRVEADRPFTVYADGDPIAELPLEVRIEPRALRVIAP
jgi:YegS/Rv2252/BmrU family lipid kinase